MSNPFADHPTKCALWREAEPYFPPEKPATASDAPSAKSADSLRMRMLETSLAQVHPAILQRRLLRAYAEASGNTASVKLRAEFEPGMALVPVANPNSHDYPIGQVCVVACHASERAAMYFDAKRKRIKKGNHLPKFEAHGDGVRPATRVEYRKFLQDLDDTQAHRLLVHIAVGHVLAGDTPPIWDPLDAADEAIRRLGSRQDEASEDIPGIPDDPDFSL